MKAFFISFSKGTSLEGIRELMSFTIMVYAYLVADKLSSCRHEVTHRARRV